MGDFTDRLAGGFDSFVAEEFNAPPTTAPEIAPGVGDALQEPVPAVPVETVEPGNTNVMNRAAERDRAEADTLRVMGGGDQLSQKQIRESNSVWIVRGHGGQVRLDDSVTPPRQSRRSGNQFLLEQTFQRMGDVDPRLTAYMQQLEHQGSQARSAANEAAVAGMEDEADSLAKIADQHATDAIEFKAAAQEAMRESDEQMRRLDDIVQGIANRQIDPNRIFGSPLSSSRFGAAIAIAAGTMAQAMNPGTANVPLGIINSAIDRDIAAQVADSQNQIAAANQQRSLLGAMREAYGDERAAAEAIRALRLQQAAADMAARAKRAEGTIAGHNFANAEIQLKQAATAAQIQAQQLNGQSRLSIRMQQRRGTADALVRQHFGGTIASANAPRRTGRGGGAPRQTGSFDEALREASERGSAQFDISEEDRQSLDELERSLPPEYVLLENSAGTQAMIRRREMVSQRAEADSRADLELGGMFVQGLGTITQGQMSRLSRMHSPEELSRVFSRVEQYQAIARGIGRLDAMAEEEGGWNVFGESIAFSDAITYMVQPLVGNTLGLGALSADDREIIQEGITNPLAAGEAFSRARLQGTLFMLRENAYAPFRAVGLDPDARQNTASPE